MKDQFKSSDLCRFFSVTRETISNWVQEGKLKASETAGGHFRFMKNDVIDFIRKHNFSLPDELKANKDINRNKIRILIIEDEEHSADILKMAIEGMGKCYDVDTAYNVFEAISKLYNSVPHLIILDYYMPGLNGTEICRLIRGNKIYDKTKILGFTGYDEGVEELLKAGANKVILKGSQQADLHMIRADVCKLLNIKNKIVRAKENK